MRLRIDLAYDGVDFRGWARQPGLRTVQGELAAALGTALRLAEPPEVVCAGRTDAGVHARGQVAHVDVDVDVDVDAAAGEAGLPDRLARRLNGILASDVRVRRVATAPPGFDARFGALWRRYAYRVCDAEAALDPLTRGHVLAWPRPLDLEAMNAASALLVGRHDFASFCKRREGATTIRTLLELSWTREVGPGGSGGAESGSGGVGVAVGRVRADAFCHSMVRSLVGCLLAVGEGRRPVEWAGEILRAGQRAAEVVVVAAHGLTLEEVAYPDADQLAARAQQTRARRVAGDTDD